MKRYTDHFPSSLDTIQVLFQRAYITRSINTQFLTIGKMLNDKVTFSECTKTLAQYIPDNIKDTYNSQRETVNVMPLP